ncbi:hypothetical protein RIB2604_01705480 [Aspergillus luchuensis]|uniref:Uncharacterized protein n=1 Tax=Aspergillus kawachii TaxID=1069201 RepID=A0A146FCP1_ASPKA|nr:hypothetical protein RIB2604_01705480 [Aspergillus luchuensis]
MSLGKVKEPFGFSNPKPLLPDRSSMIFVAASWRHCFPFSIFFQGAFNSHNAPVCTGLDQVSEGLTKWWVGSA